MRRRLEQNDMKTRDERESFVPVSGGGKENGEIKKKGAGMR